MSDKEIIDQIRDLILHRVLVPGQPIRQAEIAERLNVSRSPIREALQGLEAEGLVTYQRNRGYVVTRLSAGLLRQAYRMRELLETELLQNIKWPNPEEMDQLRDLQTNLIEARDSVNNLVRLNREFHFTIFALAQMSLFIEEVARLWRLTEPYRAVYLVNESIREEIIREHQIILECLDQRDRDLLLIMTAQHRKKSEVFLIKFLETEPVSPAERDHAEGGNSNLRLRGIDIALPSPR
jgi:DNA-binding GntR family transcriptional regulator